MSLGLHVPGGSPLHRLPAGPKLAFLGAAGTALFLIADWRPLAAALTAVVLLYAAAGIGWRTAAAQLRPALWVLAILFAAQSLVEGWSAGLILVLRFAVLILLASLVTLTTRVSDMTQAIETALRPLARLGVNPASAGLAISMAIRFIPVIAGIAGEVREAQKVRGLDRSFLAMAVPVVVRTLKMADDVADAMEARSYDPRHGGGTRGRAG